MRTIQVRDGSDDDSALAPKPPNRIVQALMWILWPAFLAAGVAEMIFFSLFDPEDLHLFGRPVDLSRTAIYTIGFFAFWILLALSSAVTLALARGANESRE